VLCFFGVSLILIQSIPLLSQTTYNYTPSEEDFVNPERGMYRYFGTFTANNGYNALSLSALQQLRTQDQQSLIYRIFYLDGFYSSPISHTVLSNIEQDFATLREAGVKAIVRFAYTNQILSDFSPPYNDTPDPQLVFTHIEQLGPILATNSDVILTVHNGFYGTWGENYYSDDFGSRAVAPITPTQQERRDAVTDSLLKYLPADRTVSVRYPYLKSIYLGLTIPDDSLTMATAYQETPISRIGYHNDCFLANYDDWTFLDTTIEKPYWATESQYILMGGESCRDLATYTNCTNALSELARFHWTYMNDYYHPDVLQRWQNEGCFTEIRKKLGYRLVLHEATLPDVLTHNEYFNLSLAIENRGWSAPKLPRPVELILRSTQNQSEYVLPLSGIDLRFLQGAQQKLYQIQNMMMTAVPAGTYDLWLFFPDDRSNLRANPHFALRLANQRIWENSTGMHDLGHTVTVQETSCPEDILLDQGAVSSGTYWANDELVASTSLEVGATVNFRAGTQIRFLPGFSAGGVEGSTFTAAIAACNAVAAQHEQSHSSRVQPATTPTTPRIKYWPNPTTSTLTVFIPQQIVPEGESALRLFISDARGQILKSYQVGAGEQRPLDLSALPVGTYFLIWHGAKGRRAEVFCKQ